MAKRKGDVERLTTEAAAYVLGITPNALLIQRHRGLIPATMVSGKLYFDAHVIDILAQAKAIRAMAQREMKQASVTAAPRTRASRPSGSTTPTSKDVAPPSTTQETGARRPGRKSMKK